MMRTFLAALRWAVFFAVATSCGGSTPPPKSPQRDPTDPVVVDCEPDPKAFAEGSQALNEGKPQLALERLERGLTALEACRPVDQVRLAATLYTLGQAHTALRQLGRARDRFESALKINRKLYGPVHDYTVETMEMLGVVSDYAGDYGDAERAFRNVIAALSERRPETHPDLLRARTNLAINLKYQKRYHEAERILEKVIPALRVANRSAGLGLALNTLGSIQYHRQDFARARASFQESVAELSAAHGASHPNVATTLFNLCGLELDAKQLDAAVAACAKSRKIRERAFPPDHPQVRSVVQRHEDAQKAAAPR